LCLCPGSFFFPPFLLSSFFYGWTPRCLPSHSSVKPFTCLVGFKPVLALRLLLFSFICSFSSLCWVSCGQGSFLYQGLFFFFSSVFAAFFLDYGFPQNFFRAFFLAGWADHLVDPVSPRDFFYSFPSFVSPFLWGAETLTSPRLFQFHFFSRMVAPFETFAANPWFVPWSCRVVCGPFSTNSVSPLQPDDSLFPPLPPPAGPSLKQLFAGRLLPAHGPHHEPRFLSCPLHPFLWC